MVFDQSTRRRVYELDFKPYPGLVVRCRKPSFRALERLTEVTLVLGDDLAGESLPGVTRMDAWGELFRAFAESLVGWSMSDQGLPVPATVDGVLSQDLDFLLDLARTWYTVVVAAPPPDPEPAAAAPREVEPETDDLEDELAQLPFALGAPVEVPVAS